MKAILCTSRAAFLAGIVLFPASIRTTSAFCVLDGSFNPGGSFSSGASVLAVGTQSDGKVIFGGYFTYYGTYTNGYPFTVTNLVRFHANGTVDTSYYPSPNSMVRAILVLPDNQVIIAGHFTQVLGIPQVFISKLDTNGSPGGGYPYPSFQAPVPNNAVYALGRQSDGRIIVGGAFTMMDGLPYSRVACLTSTGSLVSAFNPGVFPKTAAGVWSIAVHPPGTPSVDKVVIGGDFTSVGVYPRVNIARLNYDGTVDAAFSTGNDLNGPVYAVVTDYGPFTPGGINGPNIEKVLIGGAFTSFGGTRNWFARLADTGLPDFNVQSSFVDGVVKSLRVQADQRILLGGAFTHSQSNIRNGVARLIPNSDLIGVDGDWAQCFPNGATGGIVEALGLSSIGSIYVGGDFTNFESGIQGVPRPKVARLFTD